MSGTWIQTSAPTTAWTSVASDSTGQYLVASANKTATPMYTSINGGTTWTAKINGLPTLNSGNNYNFVVASDSTGQNIVTVYANSTFNTNAIFTSTNGGSLWTQQTTGLPNPNTLVNWSSVASDSTGQKLVACINGGDIYISTDGGSSWTVQTNGLPATQAWYGVASNSDGTRLVAILSNSIYTYLNGLWTLQSNAPNNLNWGAVASDSTGEKLVVIPSNSNGINYIYTSINYGVTWVQKSIPLSLFMTSVASDSTGQKIVILGRYRFSAGIAVYGGIIISKNGGTTWTQTDASSTLVWADVASNSTGSKLVAVVSSSTGNIYTYAEPPYPCFKEGSKILTDQGYKLIQDLRKGDLVKTLLHGFKPIDLIGKRDMYHPASKERIKDQLYQCSKDQFGEVFEPLVLTGCHSILVDVFVSQEQGEKSIEINEGRLCITDKKYRLPACVDERASVYEIPGTYTIYHLALENDDYYMNYGIYANGLLVETSSKRYLKELSGMELI